MSATVLVIGVDKVIPSYRAHATPATTDEIDEVFGEQQERLRDLVKQVSDLAGMDPPRRSTWLQRKYWDRRARWKKWRAERRKAEETAVSETSDG